MRLRNAEALNFPSYLLRRVRVAGPALYPSRLSPLTTGVQLLARALLRVLAPAGLVTVLSVLS